MSIQSWQVLVVEDETDSMELVQSILAHYGVRSVGAASGEEALHVVQAFTPTLIIIDLALPGIDGWSLLERFKNNRALATTPCIAITAYHTAELAIKTIDAGFDAYFAKPLDATSFMRELERVVNSG